MRSQFIDTTNTGETYYTCLGEIGTYIDEEGDEFDGMPAIVLHDAPWATICVAVDGGYCVFESNDDYETWSNQQ